MRENDFKQLMMEIAWLLKVIGKSKHREDAG